jgi:hypothetical protein
MIADAASASAAAADASAALSAEAANANATVWVPGASYVANKVVWGAPNTGQLFRCILAHSGITLEPWNDSAHWVQVGPSASVSPTAGLTNVTLQRDAGRRFVIGEGASGDMLRWVYYIAPATAGYVYSIGVDMNTDSISSDASYIEYKFSDAANNVVLDGAGVSVPDYSGQWNRLTQSTAVSPAGSAFIHFRLIIRSSETWDRFDFRRVKIERNPTPTPYVENDASNLVANPSGESGLTGWVSTISLSTLDLGVAGVLTGTTFVQDGKNGSVTLTRDTNGLLTKAVTFFDGKTRTETLTRVGGVLIEINATEV